MENARTSILFLSLIYILFLIIIYFTKKRANNIDNIIYKKLLLTVPLVITLEYICNISAILNFNKTLSEIICKIYLCLILVWAIIFSLYIYSITALKTKDLKVYYDSLSRKILIYGGFFDCILVILLNLNLVNNSTGSYVNGYSVIALCVGIVTLVVYDTINFFSKLSQLKEREKVPMLSLFIALIILVIFNKFFPEIQIVSCTYTFLTFIMYFTIENPDMKMIEELEKAKLEAEKANRAKSEFLSNMSHEIRTPLNAIVGFSDCIFEEDTLDDAKQDAKDIKVASDNLLEIVNGILDISKIEANKMELVEKEYKIDTLLDALEKMTKVRLDDKPIDFEHKYAEDLPHYLYGDGQKIRQILTNLLTNAVKYTERGKIMFTVDTVNSNGYANFVMSVEDTGRGIKEDKINNLFNKFERLEEDKNTTLEGTGLGLAITKKLVEMMGGKIVVQSKYGQGSKFTVYVKQKIVTNPTIIEEEKNEQNNIIFKDKKVLLVDDNKINLKVAAKMLLNHGIESVNVESGFDCIEKVKLEKFDLILLDDMMPKMSGSDTLIKLKKIENFNTPVVVTTANAIEGMKDEYINEKGFDDYLSKPIEKQELIRILNKYLN